MEYHFCNLKVATVNIVSLGSQDVNRLCEIEYNPEWGENGALQEYKGKSYCCKHYVGSGKGPVIIYTQGSGRRETGWVAKKIMT